jgi:glycosyltransferase involved in cell wall biosynthesis
LIEVLPQLITSSSHHREFHIIGVWSLQSQLQSIASQYPEHIKLYGWSNREQIKHIAQNTHYCLCPSVLLESFGMSALEGSKLWLPIIWPCKWWLEQFVIQDIWKLRTSDTPQALLHQLLYIDQNHQQQYSTWKQDTIQLASRFWTQQRSSQTQLLLESN